MAEEIDPNILVQISQKHNELMLLKDPLEFFDGVANLYFKHKNNLKILWSMSSSDLERTLSKCGLLKARQRKHRGPELLYSKVVKGEIEGSEEKGQSHIWLTYTKELQADVLTPTENSTLPQTYEEDDENEEFASAHSDWLKRGFLFSSLEDNPEYSALIVESFRRETKIRIEEEWTLMHGDVRKRLEKLEKKVMSGCCSNFELFDVEIDDDTVIHTAIIHASSETKGKHSSTPLLLLHGFGGAIPAFDKLYRGLAYGGDVYAIDLPGFGLTTRVNFPSDPVGCEDEVVNLIDKWRIKMKINKMILLGHSLGGYFAGAYFLQYHEHVQHLIMLEPWGMYSKKDDEGKSMFGELKRKIAEALINLSHVDPALVLFYFGHLVTWLLLYLFMDEETRHLYGKDCLKYFVACSTEELLTGVHAFIEISNKTFTYPYRPLTNRLIKLLESVKVPITFIYGRQSDICKGGISCTGELGRPSVIIHCIDKAGHHIQVQKPADVVKYILSYIFTNEAQP